ncbi:inositol monophosphatase family protein [Jannaschia sp. W003]|uniref:inositol monophosphatase family protein n=1 Tax=Jannaschia sp. W003 TaxID=2867012 RepID=UPI0021A5365C|nr:inositol monophosphatase family protein [Jannaschia sp. W003]UWQ22301.1 inositol monophosphatase [Jannaschia sp. W003]
MPLTPTQSDALVAAIRTVAAEEIRPRFRRLDPADADRKRAFDDLVTVADRAAERAMTARFEVILPDAAVIGEEAISEGTASLESVGAERCVVIDPIDGTWNYAHGIANYGVIVAVLEAGETVWGCLYDPSFDDWVMAARGGGCHYHRAGAAPRPLRTAQDAPPPERLRGNVGEYLFPEAERLRLAPLVPRFRRHMTLGASLAEYRQMALGGTDFCLNGWLNVWDHAAGALCLAEAGGCSRLLDGSPYRPALSNRDAEGGARLLNARSPALWDTLAPIFNEALA